MNALWITRMSDYRQTPLALESANRIIGFKIARESALLRHYGRVPVAIPAASLTIGEMLLTEARAARHFWREFRMLIPAELGFRARRPHGLDTVNRLLDVGYHHLTGIVRRMLEERNAPADLGLFHRARSAASAPLAYDLVELFRADAVDAEALRFVRLKKRQPFHFDQRDVPIFLGRLNARLARKHYIESFASCRTYRYYMELQILKFIRAVDERTAVELVRLPDRHDTRCLTKQTIRIE